MPGPKSSPNRVERFQAWARSNRVVAFFIVVGIVVVGLAMFTDTARKLAAVSSDLFEAASATKGMDAVTYERLKRTADRVDRYFIRATSETILDYRPPTTDEFQVVAAELRMLQVAFHAQHLADNAEVAQVAIERWNKLSPSRVIVPQDWQMERLKAQREEWVSLFASMGYNSANITPTGIPQT